MTARLARLALRSLAITIAIAALIDPAWSSRTPQHRPVIAIHLTSTAPAGVDRALRDSLGARELITRDVTGTSVPCAIDEDCVVVADGSIDAGWSGDARSMSLITQPVDGQPNVAVRSVLIASAHRSAAGLARVELSATGVRGRRTEIRIFDGAALIGSATHEWSEESATVDVPWWPISVRPRALRVEAVPVEGEITSIDNHIDTGVAVADARLPVLVFDARPSWNSTFVRRALEDDPRFAVRYRGRIAPSLSAGTANGRLDAGTLDAVSVVIIGAPDTLTPGDVALLDRYVRTRGGSLVLLPEQRIGGALSPLVAGAWTEHLAATPETIGLLRASETLRATGLPVIADVIARAGSSPSIVSMPSGNGRIIVSGAMDAWRYRDGAFDRFWRSLVAQAAAAGDGLTLKFDRPVASAGTRVGFTIRDRRLEPRNAIEASAVMRCGDGPASVLRLWPAGTMGAFAGELPATSRGDCTVEAAVDDRQTVTGIAIVDRPARGTAITLANLAAAVRASGGTVARAGEEATVGRALANAPTLSRVVSAHPMRAPWWILPFAGCLSAEWWLRRRAGLK